MMQWLSHQPMGWMVLGSHLDIGSNLEHVFKGPRQDSPDSWGVCPGKHAWTLSEHKHENKHKQTNKFLLEKNMLNSSSLSKSKRA